VNRRLVRDRVILHAIHEAYRNLMPGAVFPSVLLFLDLPAEEVDVNVHPAKIEVRFRHPAFVHDFARDVIRQALIAAKPIPNFPQSAAYVPGATAAPEAGEAFRAAAGASGDSAPSGVPRAVIPPLGPLGDSGLAEEFQLSVAPAEPVPQRFEFGAPGNSATAAALGAFGAEAAVQPAIFAEHFRDAASQRADAPANAQSIGALKPLGQVNSSFIVAVNGEGLWIIDQHVAHERILFEQHLKARREGALTGQRLLVPIIVELSPGQLAIFERIAEELSANGFDAAMMGPRTVAIQAAPAGIASADAERLLLEILDGIEREDAGISIDSLQSKIAASTACRAAIKINMALDQTKMEWLLDELARTEAPMSCPHGRPIVLRYSMREIERAFHRI
jgi:DNA mismatch repair protein MutL